MRNKLKKILEEKGLDLICITSPKTIGYLTSLFIDPIERYENLFYDKNDNLYLILPKLDENKAINKLKNENIHIFGYEDGKNPYENILNNISYDINKIGIDTEHIYLNKFNFLKKELKFKEYIAIDENIKNYRLIKSEAEIDKMRKASKFADRCMEIAKSNLKVGITELELKSIIENEIKKEGIEKMSFDTIVLFGENASNPHGSSSNRALKENEYVLLDLGCYYEEYASDETRTIEFGVVSDEAKKIYDIVLKANTSAIKACKIGMKLSDIDKIARDIITEAGYGIYFTHRLGHGIGINCHEFPDVSQFSDTIIQKGMTFTIEPGIYIPNKIGIRIEDDIYISENGVEVLTKYEK